MEKTINFLNNQRYILGEGEKKKILTIYLGDERYKILLNLLDKFLILILVVLFSIISVLERNISFKIIFIILTLFFFIGFIYYKKNNLVLKIKKISDFFLIENKYKKNNIFYAINVIVLSIIGIYIYTISSETIIKNIFFVDTGNISSILDFFLLFLNTILLLFILPCLGLLIIFINIYLNKINLIHILILPFVIIIGVILYVGTYIFLSLKNFTIIKTLRKQNNLFKDFYEITKK